MAAASTLSRNRRSAEHITLIVHDLRAGISLCGLLVSLHQRGGPCGPCGGLAAFAGLYGLTVFIRGINGLPVLIGLIDPVSILVGLVGLILVPILRGLLLVFILIRCRSLRLLDHAVVRSYGFHGLSFLIEA